MTRRIVVGITGASAPHYGIALLRRLRVIDDIETHLVVSAGARRTIAVETDLTVAGVTTLADVSYSPGDLAAPIASGSFPVDAMAVAPCSMRTLAAVAHGLSDNLLTRAADVALKERRKLVLVTRETPLSLIHLRNMTAVTEAGATVMPPVPAFYHAPVTVDDLIAHTTGRLLDTLDIPNTTFTRWGTSE
ncbi:MAG TPA: UbiX family flavin prenyltransferase [Streptosporangiaceae bacterium]|jgi:polyprenyl P-hydroxybenzoate/phenylacrylic acid decarboxylase-like protein